MFKKRLLWQIYPTFLLIIILSVAGVAWYASRSFEDFYLQQVADTLKARASIIEKQILPILTTGDFSQIDNLCIQLGSVSSTRITIILPDGRVIADSDESPDKMENHSNRQEITQAMNEGLGVSQRSSPTLGINMMYLAIPVKQDDTILAFVRTAVSLIAIDETLSNIHKNLFWGVVIIAACAAVISLFISKTISRPVEKMTEVANLFATGELDMRVSVPNAIELADLANALNEMARQLNARIDAITKERGQTEAILSSMIEGVMAVDSDGRIVSINKAASDLLAIETAQPQGLSVEEVIRNPQLQQYIKDTINKQIETEESFVLNYQERILQLSGSNLTDYKGRSSGAVLVVHDITRTCRLEEIRRDFVANVSHELKTPITSIKGFVETLNDGAIEKPEQARRFLEIIARHTERLNAIVDDLLSLSLLEEEAEKRRLFFESAYLKPVLTSAMELAKIRAEKKNINIELQCDDTLDAKINSALIEQAVLNLIDNAVKYSPEESKIQVVAQKKDKEILISVTDYGCGIDKEHLERIFERFYVVDKSRSRKLGGTGLGLSIVKHIMQVHGGYITVESRINQGSTFTIHLPYHEIDPGKND